jgi:hypothetical protein
MVHPGHKMHKQRVASAGHEGQARAGPYLDLIGLWLVENDCISHWSKTAHASGRNPEGKNGARPKME